MARSAPSTQRQSRDQIAKAHHRRDLVDDDAHGAAFRMRAEIDQRVIEARIAHARHGDQHLPVEIVRFSCLKALHGSGQ